MNSAAFLGIFLVLLALYLGLECLLILLNMRHVRRHSASVPSFAAAFIDEETFRKSCAYTLARSRFALFSLFYSNAVLLLFIFSGGFGAADTFVSGLPLHAYPKGVVYVFLVAIFFSVSDLPLSYYGTFVLEE